MINVYILSILTILSLNLLGEPISCESILRQNALVEIDATKFNNINAKESSLEELKRYLEGINSKIKPKIHSETILLTKSIKLNLNWTDKNLTPKQFLTFKNQLISSFNKFLKVVPNEWVPAVINLELHYEHSNPILLAGTIRIPYKFIKNNSNEMKINKLRSGNKNYSKHPIKSEASLFHELGHLVFINYLVKQSNKFKAYNEYLLLAGQEQVLQESFKEQRELILSELKQLNNSKSLVKIKELKKSFLSDKLDSLTDSLAKEMEKIQNKYEELYSKFEKEFNELGMSADELNEFIFMINEFVADIFSLSSSKLSNGNFNPKVISEILHFSLPKSIEGRTYIDRVTGIYGMYSKDLGENLANVPAKNIYRDFSVNTNSKNWLDMNGHTGLNPARYHVWKYYYSNPIYRSRPEYLLKKIVEAASNELFDRLKVSNETSDFTPFSSSEMNERLIQEIDKNLN